jgi:hypothetical protein
MPAGPCLIAPTRSSSEPTYFGSVSAEFKRFIPDTDAAFIAMCHYRFESVDDFIEPFTAHQERLQGDMAGYTDIEPVIQFNEIALAP